MLVEQNRGIARGFYLHNRIFGCIFVESNTFMLRVSVYFQVPEHPDRFYKQYMDDYFTESIESGVAEARVRYVNEGIKCIKLMFFDSGGNRIEDAIINFDS